MTDKFSGVENAELEIDGNKLQMVENDGHSISDILYRNFQTELFLILLFCSVKTSCFVVVLTPKQIS